MNGLLAATALLTLLSAQAQGVKGTGGDFDFKAHMDTFKNPEVVHEFMRYFESGSFGKDKPFNILDPDSREEAISIVNLFYNLKPLESTNSTQEFMLWMLNNLNLDYMTYGLAVTLNQNPDLAPVLGDVLVEWYNALTNYFVPGHIMDEVKTRIEEGTYDRDNTPMIVPDENDKTAYFREDLDLNNMFYNWHLTFPSWLDSKRYGDLWDSDFGDIFYDYHNQLVTAYYMRSITDDGHVSSLDWNSRIKDGYKTEIVNTVGRPLSSRAPNHPQVDNAEYRELMEIHKKIESIKINRTFHYNESFVGPLPEGDDSFVNLLAHTVYNTTHSVNPSYYKSYYDAAVKYLASVGSNPTEDGGGLAGSALTALRDPAFYGLLANVNSVIRFYRDNYLPSQDRKILTNEDITINSFDVGRLETFFEPFPMSVKIALNRIHDPVSYIVNQLRLNHRPFEMRWKITSKKQVAENVLISVFLAHHSWPADNGLDVDLYQEIDSFKIKVKPGENSVRVFFNESQIFVGRNYPMYKCGIPRNLALPKGREKGLKMKMIATMSHYVGDQPDEDEPHPSEPWRAPLCGNRKLNHGRPFGFPFDRNNHGSIPEFESDADIVVKDVLIYHKKQKFSDTVIV